MFTFNLKDQELILTPKKAVFWKNKDILIVSDLHLGKVLSEFENELVRLENLIIEFTPRKVIILGDLFDRTYNKNFNVFKIFRKSYSSVEIILVKGNHDKLKSHIYDNLNLEIFELQKTIEPFIFLHQPVTRNYDLNINNYFISGHVHPAVKLNMGRSACFCFGKNQGIMPAFSNWVRNSLVNPDNETKIYTINRDFVRCLE